MSFVIPELAELTKIDANQGDIPIYYDKEGHVYLWPAGESIPIPLKDRTGDEWPTRLFEEWDSGNKFHKVHSVQKDGDSYQVVIHENHGDGVAWGIIPASSSGILSWKSSLFSENVGEIEERVKLDLNKDGKTGIVVEVTPKTDDVGDVVLAVNSDGDSYIKDKENVLKLKDFEGNGLRFDFDQKNSDGSGFEREAVQAAWDSEAKQYVVAIEETFTSTWEGKSYSDTEWVINAFNENGGSVGQDLFNVDIVNYEKVFNYDFNGDKSIGFDNSALEKITADTSSDSGVTVKRFKGNGDIYIVDNGATKKVADEYGFALELEREERWEGGSSSSVVVAAEGTANGGYVLVVKHQETHSGGEDEQGSREENATTLKTSAESQSQLSGSDPEVSLASTSHSGFNSAHNIIERSKNADTIISTDYNSAYALATSFTGALEDDILITFEEDNGWLNVNGSYSGGFVSHDHQYLAGTSSPYSSFSPASSSSATGRTTLVAADAKGDHANGTAEGTIEYIVANGGEFDGNRVHFNLSNVGHSGGPDEPDLARINSGSNIDRGINITQGFNTTTTPPEPRDQFLEVLPSELEEGGLNVYFYGNEAASGDAFNNPVSAFGFYLMGREIKRDVFLDVRDTSNSLIHSTVTTVPGDASQAVVEYISFQAAEDQAVSSFSLREAFNSSIDTASARDIFSIDNLSLKFAVDGEEGGNSEEGEDEEEQTSTYYEIYNLDKDGKSSWSNPSFFTESIAGFESVVKEDINKDGKIGIDVSSLTQLTTDTAGIELWKSTANTVHIVDPTTKKQVDVKDQSGGFPTVFVDEKWDNGYFRITPIAASLWDGGSSDDYYRVAVKVEDAYFENSTDKTPTTSRVEWEIYKVSLDGILDTSGTIFTPSITTYEDEFKQDLNGDKDFSGNIDIALRNSDTFGVKLGEADGQIFIVDGEKQIAIQDSWIEHEDKWEGGSSKAVVKAVEKNEAGLYQVAVKQDHTWTELDTGRTGQDSGWQVYAIKEDGSVDFSKTIWSDSITPFETSLFKQDVNQDEFVGVNTGKLERSSRDKNGHYLKKDIDGLLYVFTPDDKLEFAVTNEFNEFPSFDFSGSWGTSNAVAVEKNDDNSYSLAVERTEKYSGDVEKFWEVLSLSSTGVIGDSSWSSSIEAKETTIFKDDLDLSGSIGFNLSQLIDVATDLGDVRLKRKQGITNNRDQFFIEDSTGGVVEILYSWGDSPDYTELNIEADVTFRRDAVAAEKTTLNGKDVYVVAIKESEIRTIDGGENVDVRWKLDYVDLKGSILEEDSIETGSIQSYESIFKHDLDSDDKVGLNLAGLSAIGTDSQGVSVSRNGDAIYITDDNLTSNKTFLVQDYWGDTPDIEWGDENSSSKSRVYAVESFEDPLDKINKYLLVVKNEEIFEGDTPTESWQTFKIKEKNVGQQDWYLDYNSATTSKSVRKIEPLIKQDLDGDKNFAVINPTTKRITTDLSTTGQTGISLLEDANGKGGLYLQKGAQITEIVDPNGGSVDFAPIKWGGIKKEQKAYAAEAVLKDGDIASYNLLVKETETDLAGNVTTKWNNYEVSRLGVLDQASKRSSDNSELFEKDLNQDLSGDSKIFNPDTLTLSALTTDSGVDKLYTDDANRLYVQLSGSNTRQALFDSDGDALVVDERYVKGNATINKTAIAIESLRTVDTPFLRLLVESKETTGEVTKKTYETFNVNQTTFEADQSTTIVHSNLKPLEIGFNMDLDDTPGVYSYNQKSAVKKSTDTYGAELRSVGNILFVTEKTGGQETTYDIVDKASRFNASLDVESKESGKPIFKKETLAIEKKLDKKDEYRLIVKETSTFNSESDVSYLQYTLEEDKKTNSLLLDRSSIEFLAAGDIDETMYQEDFNGDGSKTRASTKSSTQGLVKKGAAVKIKSEFESRANSDFSTIKSASDATDAADIAIFGSKTSAESAARNDIQVNVAKDVSSQMLEQAKSDAGTAKVSTSTSSASESVGSTSASASSSTSQSNSDSTSAAVSSQSSQASSGSASRAVSSRSSQVSTGSSPRAASSSTSQQLGSASEVKIKPLTDLLDFSVTSTDPSQFGQIQSVTIVLNDVGADDDAPIFYKRDKSTGGFVAFTYDANTGEGALWNAQNKTLTINVRDNGRYDWNDQLGVIRDPGFVGLTVQSSTTPTPPTPTPKTKTKTKTKTSLSTSSTPPPIQYPIPTENGYLIYSDAADSLKNQRDVKFRMMGGSDTVQIIGGKNNFVNGNQGDDQLIVLDSQDSQFLGGKGRDLFEVRGGTDNYFYGAIGEDVFKLIAGKSHISGGDDNDTIEVLGAVAGTFVNGNRGNDLITGVVAGVTYRGGKDDDLLAVCQGDVWGDLGVDTFQGVSGDGYAVVRDYTVGEDKIDLSMVQGESWKAVDNGLMLTDSSGDQIMLLVGIESVDQVSLV
ncbi:putative secreted protease domain protein [Synechococcus sp. BIOS-E4-1]|uniref:calcium-binding protein n=1 Tax=Synechococcus sp. BIOS-E4-1 TaxID=1400864 RepID=UPI0016468F6B|nr:calcium-binding protein [Synechococcus sp. BIOS-E4-1]QNI53720.1 putative secreted protease domain protein [Synechococcus sp. BIOS-E4-1]